MTESATTPTPIPEPAPQRNWFKIISASAFEAFTGAFLVYILGGVALSIAGSFAGKMVPSAPPGFASWNHARGLPSMPHEGWNIEGNGPLIGIFAIFFAHSLWVNFRTRQAALGRRAARILARLRENWFSIIIGNAIGAWVATLLMDLPNFSAFHLLWDWMLGLTFPVIRQAAISCLGASHTASVGDWLGWYHGNSIKLAFWVLYLAGALDDLGVPNIKAVARRAWRRYQKRKTEPAVSPVSPAPSSARP